LPYDGGARRARVRPTAVLLWPRPAPLTANFPAGLPFNHARLFGGISAEVGRAIVPSRGRVPGPCGGREINSYHPLWLGRPVAPSTGRQVMISERGGGA